MISIIIPIYNRPQEVRQIIDSLEEQTFKGFEIVVVEDGSTVDSKEVCDSYGDDLHIRYFIKDNSGPALARNYGAERAEGDFFVILDSDCILPETYMERVHYAVYTLGVDFYGGADMADDDFSALQKAVSYSMTSFFTTGGIRGGRQKLDKFLPRSFNMGVKADLFRKVGGFSDMRFGEDIDFSMRLLKEGVSGVLLSGAEVYHKRRTDLRSFFRQVYFSGVARVSLTKRHPGSLKLVHLLPSMFVLGSFVCLLLSLFNPLLFTPLIAISLIWFIDSSVRNRSLKVGLLSVATSFTQLFGYGIGFLSGLWQRVAMGRSERETFKTNFF